MLNPTNAPSFPSGLGLRLPDDASWRDLCFRIICAYSGMATKKQIENELHGHPKTEGKKFWKYAVSRTVQNDPRLVRASKGVWALRSKFSPEEQAQLDAQRLKEHPPLGPRKPS